jgi:fluoride exporter
LTRALASLDPAGVTLVLIAAGGAAGAVARFVVDNAVLDRFGGAFPLGILVVNLSGAFVLGLLAALIVDRGVLPADLRSPLMVGFLGAYTTFSTLMLDSWRLFEDGLPLLALANIAGSTVLGVVAVVGGLVLGRSLG